jgi:hypothetical protein
MSNDETELRQDYGGLFLNFLEWNVHSLFGGVKMKKRQ